MQYTKCSDLYMVFFGQYLLRLALVSFYEGCGHRHNQFSTVEIRNRRSGQGKSIPPYKDFTAEKRGMISVGTGGD